MSQCPVLSAFGCESLAMRSAAKGGLGPKDAVNHHPPAWAYSSCGRPETHIVLLIRVSDWENLMWIDLKVMSFLEELLLRPRVSSLHYVLCDKAESISMFVDCWTQRTSSCKRHLEEFGQSQARESQVSSKRTPYRECVHVKSSRRRFLVNMGRHLRSISHHVLPRGALIVPKWLGFKGLDSLYDSVYLCVCVCFTLNEIGRRRQSFWGPISRSRTNFYANAATWYGRSYYCPARAGRVGIRCRNAQQQLSKSSHKKHSIRL